MKLKNVGSSSKQWIEELEDERVIEESLLSENKAEIKYKLSSKDIKMVPGDGQCLFNAIGHMNGFIRDGSVHPLRKKVVDWVIKNWNSDLDMAPIMPHLAKLIDAPLRMEHVFDDYSTLNDYIEKMSNPNDYGTAREAAIAAFICNINLDIYELNDMYIIHSLGGISLGHKDGTKLSIVLSNKTSKAGAHYDVYYPPIGSELGSDTESDPEIDQNQMINEYPFIVNDDVLKGQNLIFEEVNTNNQ